MTLHVTQYFSYTHLLIIILKTTVRGESQGLLVPPEKTDWITKLMRQPLDLLCQHTATRTSGIQPNGLNRQNYCVIDRVKLQSMESEGSLMRRHINSANSLIVAWRWGCSLLTTHFCTAQITHTHNTVHVVYILTTQSINVDDSTELVSSFSLLTVIITSN